MVCPVGYILIDPKSACSSPPIHKHSALGTNVLLITVDGLSKAWLNITPIAALEKSAWRFTNAFSNSPDRFGGVSAVLASTYQTGSSPLMESIQTLGERLAYEGYGTHAMVSICVCGAFCKLHQGFDQFQYIPQRCHQRYCGGD